MRYPVSCPLPHVQAGVLDQVPPLSSKSLSDARCPLSSHPSLSHHQQRSRKLHTLAFIFNLATHIPHPFSSFKVNKNKFQDFLRSLIYSHMNQQKWVTVTGLMNPGSSSIIPGKREPLITHVRAMHGCPHALPGKSQCLPFLHIHGYLGLFSPHGVRDIRSSWETAHSAWQKPGWLFSLTSELPVGRLLASSQHYYSFF